MSPFKCIQIFTVAELVLSGGLFYPAVIFLSSSTNFLNLHEICVHLKALLSGCDIFVEKNVPPTFNLNSM